MSEPTNPAPTPEPTAAPAPAATPTPAPARAAQDANRKPPQPGGPRQGGNNRPFPRGDRPRQDGTKPPPLDVRDFAASKPNSRELDKSIEDELNAALQGFDISGTVVKEESRKAPAVPGQPQTTRKQGTIVGFHGKDVFVEVPGGRGQGVINIQQFEGRVPQIGETLEFDIDGYDGANGLLKLNMGGAAQVVTDWSSVTRGMIVEAKVTGLNKTGTGLLVEVNGLRGFMPISQIDMYRVEKPEDYLNQKIKCQITELDREERNLIVSRRALLEMEREKIREQLWAKIEEGQVMTGIVRSVKPFGAFVDLGGADGLIPVSELSWNRVGDPSEIVQVGQKVEVKVAKLDRDARKIALSLKAMIRSPWDDFAEVHKTGARLVGKVTRIADFGAFVEVAPGIEGLIHVSELSTQRVRRVRDVLNEGQEITVQIQSIDTAARRMSLSLKALVAEAEASDAAAEEAEKADDIKAAEERMAARLANPNLRGGIGSGRALFDTGE